MLHEMELHAWRRRGDVLMPPFARKLIRSALLLTIMAETVLLWVQWQEAMTKVAVARNARELQKAQAEKLSAEAQTANEVAANAVARQAAEAKIAEAKAEQEYQAAVQAERRAAADADKLDAEARTAAQAAANAVQRMRAEAAKALAELNAINARIKIVWRYPYNCSGFNTFADCVEGLRQATANGGWRTPKPIRPVLAPARAVQLTRSCRRKFEGWKGEAIAHAAFAAGDTDCAWSAGRLPSVVDARQQALEQCEKFTTNCQIYSEK